jgi:transcriptional regulator with XRE-family HTH domain
MLAHKLGVSEGYIGNIENPKQTAKYNIRMLSRIAIALELDSYLDLFPEKPFSNDLVKIKINLFDKGEVKKD